MGRHFFYGNTNAVRHWTHLAMTFDGLTATLCVDGNPVATSMGYFFTNGASLTTGAQADLSQLFSG